MSITDQVQKLYYQGKDDAEIRRKLHISEGSLDAAKAHITRRVWQQAGEQRLYVVPVGPDNRNLSARDYAILLVISNKSRGESGENIGIQDPVTRAPLPKDRIREIILELKTQGASHQDVHKDPRLANVDSRSISAYLAHYSRKSYENRTINR